MDRRGFLAALGLGLFAPKFGRWFKQGSGLLVRPAPYEWYAEIADPAVVVIGGIPGGKKNWLSHQMIPRIRLERAMPWNHAQVTVGGHVKILGGEWHHSEAGFLLPPGADLQTVSMGITVAPEREIWGDDRYATIGESLPAHSFRVTA